MTRVALRLGVEPQLGPLEPVGDEQLDYLEQYPDLQLVAYSPILKGLFNSKDKRGADFWAMQPYLGPDADARLAAVDEVAKASGASGNQVVLAWLLASEKPRVLPLIGPRTFDQYLECIEALDVELTPAQLEQLDAAKLALERQEEPIQASDEELAALRGAVLARADTLRTALVRARLLAEAALLEHPGWLTDLGLDAKPRSKRPSRAPTPSEP